jgi:6-pyruvoyl-tetrahydropterin synthase
LAAKVDQFKKLYDFDLMMDGWHIKWYQVTDEESINWIIAWLTKLADKEAFKNKYWVWDDLWVLLFAMWDWNHSLATAKAIWEAKKQTLTEEEKIDHPARFAIVEINNVHDTWINFEPIHRVLFNVDHEHLFNEMAKYFREVWSDLDVKHFNSKEELKAELPESTSSMHYCRWANQDGYTIIWIKNPRLNLEVWNIQAFLDYYLKANPNVTIDYIHGEEVTEQLWRKKWNQCFLFPIMDKSDFFKTVVVDWALPRKTFSMWEAEEKRFYLEARKIVK